MTRRVGRTPRRHKRKQRKRKKRRGWIGQGSMWVSCRLVVITPPHSPFPPSTHPLQGPLALPTCGCRVSCLLELLGQVEGWWWWVWAFEPARGRWACPGLAQIWAVARALSGGSGWPRSGGGVWGKNVHVGVLASWCRSLKWLGTFSSVVQIDCENFETSCLNKRPVHSFLNGFSWKKLYNL